jgi:hypothetical protein
MDRKGRNLMTGITGRNNFEENEYWVYQQQRFEAALAFATLETWDQSELRSQPIWRAVELADELIAKLEETRTKTKDESE